MSGAQGKAIEIAGGVGVIAEVDPSRIRTRHEQGWVGRVSQNLDEVFDIAKSFIKKIHPVSIAYIGNVVDLLEYIVKKGINVDLLSDQTSCHAPYNGGYCPQGISFEERTRLLETDRVRFKTLVDRSLKRHFELIKALVGRGTYFFDYGNSFMKAVYDAGRVKTASMWDVMGGVARRAWARNENSIRTCAEYNIENRGTDHITIPFLADEDLVKKTVAGALKTGKTQ